MNNPFNNQVTAKYLAKSTGIVILHSGGIDSTALLLLLRESVVGKTLIKRLYSLPVTCLSIDYGQRHMDMEITMAQRLCKELNVHHEFIDLATLGATMSTDHPLYYVRSGGISPENATPEDTVVPYRNMLLLTVAAMYAKKQGYNQILIGANHNDLKAYPDCRPEFFNSAVTTLQYSISNWPVKNNKAATMINVPFHHMDKVKILEAVKEAGQLDLLKYSYTCYAGRAKACGLCPACTERVQAFKAIGEDDPMEYEIDIDHLE